MPALPLEGIESSRSSATLGSSTVRKPLGSCFGFSATVDGMRVNIAPNRSYPMKVTENNMRLAAAFLESPPRITMAMS